MSTPGGTPAPRAPRPPRPSAPPAYDRSVTLEPEERRSLAMTQMCLQAAIWGALSGLFGLLTLLAPGRRGLFFIYGGASALMLGAAWTGSRCEPVGKTLLMIYSGLVALFIPIGTIQAVFQFVHLTRPEAAMVFSGRDRFSPEQAADIRIYKESSPNLTAWIRIMNFLTLAALAFMLILKIL